MSPSLRLVFASLLAALLAALLAGPAARADGPAAPPPPDATAATAPAAAGPTADEALRRELEAALRKDQAQKKDAPAAATAAAPEPAVASSSPLVRGIQSLNPDASAIIDATAGFQSGGPLFIAGDDPVFNQSENSRRGGFTVQEAELAFSAVVDPYFKGELYLTIPNLGGLEVEEAVVTTTSLPWNLQARAGSFRGAFGRQNGQHLHVQDFTLRPLVNAAFLGPDGLRGPGAQLSWLAPLPFILTLYAEGFSLQAPQDPAAPLASFGGTVSSGATFALHAKTFFPLTDELSLFAGLSAASGNSPGALAAGVPAGLGAATTQLGGLDVYVKWKPSNVAQGYLSLAWQTELIGRLRGASVGAAGTSSQGIDTGSTSSFGGYSQLVLQVSRRWFIGLRGDYLDLGDEAAALARATDLPDPLGVQRETRGSLSFTFQASEFARLRLEGHTDHLVAAPRAKTGDRTLQGLLLQLEVSIGAHGAHAF